MFAEELRCLPWDIGAFLSAGNTPGIWATCCLFTTHSEWVNPAVKRAETVYAEWGFGYTLNGRQVMGTHRVRIGSISAMIDDCCEGS